MRQDSVEALLRGPSSLFRALYESGLDRGHFWYCQGRMGVRGIRSRRFIENKWGEMRQLVYKFPEPYLWVQGHSKAEYTDMRVIGVQHETCVGEAQGSFQKLRGCSQ